MISRYIDLWGCCACTLLAFPALALSTLTCICVERPVKSHPETFCVGVSDSGDSGRIRGSGRMNNVYLFSAARPFISLLNHPALTNLFSSSDACPKSVCPNPPRSRHGDFAADFFALITVTAAIGKTSFACVMSVQFLCILVLAPIETWGGNVLDRVFLSVRIIRSALSCANRSSIPLGDG
jgi:hypothetical protein